MDRDRPNSKEVSKSSAGETSESSRAEVPGPSGREAKRGCSDVQSTGFETSQEEEEGAGGSSSSLQSPLILSQPLVDTQASSNLDATPVEVLSSPLLEDIDPSPPLSSNALDALDGWSLGSNMFFSDTGSGGGFLESQASTAATEEECGVAPPPPLPRRLGKGSSSGKGKGSGKASTGGRARLSPPVLLPPVSASEKKYERRKSDELFAVLDVVRGSSASGSSSLRMSDDRILGGDDDDDEEMVLDSAPENEPSGNVKSTEKTAGNDLPCAFALSPNVGIDAGESSPGSSGEDLFSDDENMVLKSDSLSSLTVEFDPDSPEREITNAKSRKREKWLRQKKAAQTLAFEKKQQKNKRDRSPDSDSEKQGNEKSTGKNPEKQDGKTGSVTTQNDDKSKQTEKSSDQKQGKSCKNNNGKSAGNTAQNDDESRQNSNKRQKKSYDKNNSKSAGRSTKKVDKSKQRNNKKQKKPNRKETKKAGAKTSQKLSPSPHISQTSSSKDMEFVAKTCSNVIEVKSDSQSSGSELFSDVKHLKSNEQLHVADKTKSVENFSTSNRLSLKRGAGTLARGKKIDDGDGKSIVSSLPFAMVEDRVDTEDSGSNVEDGKKDGRGIRAKGSMRKKSPVEESKGEIKRKRGQRTEETTPPAIMVVSDKLTIKKSGGKGRTVEKTPADDSRTKGADGSTALDDGRTPGDGRTPVVRKARSTAADGKTRDGKTQDDGKTRDGKTVDDGKTVFAGKTKDDGRSRSPSLFEYESDSMLAPSALAIHARKPKTSTDKKILGRSERGETSSAEKTRPGSSQLQDSNLSQIKALRKTGQHRSTSSKSALTDSGIAATTPASFTLASRPGLAKHLTTSTPLEQYRSMVGLGNPKKKGVKKGKRPREDSGNDSDFILESNISMLSPVWPAPHVRAQGGGRGHLGVSEPAAANPKKGRAGKIGKGTVPEMRPEDVVTGKNNASKRKKLGDVNELLPRNEVNLKKTKKKDDVETPPTATQIIGTTDVKTVGPQKKKPDGKDPVSNAAKARQLNVEERLLQELDDIDQNYSLIIDDD